MSPIRVGVIGYGLSAKVFQIPFIQASAAFELAAIVQRSGDDAATQHPDATIYRSVPDLLSDASVDLVVVSTPPPTHFEFVSAALQAGKHVLVEKPFCPTTAECDELIALAKSKDRLLTVFQNRRWDADFATLRDVISRGDIGRVIEFESHFDRFDPVIPPRDAADAPGTGVVYDLGAHLFDQVLQLFGTPERVTAVMARQRPGAGEGNPFDACTVLLHYEGLLATVKASAMSAAERQLRFWVRGDRGSYLKYHLDPQEDQLVAGMQTGDAEFGHEPASLAGELVTVTDGKLEKRPLPNTAPPPTYRQLYDQLGKALQSQGKVPVRPEDARNVIKVIELAKESAAKSVTITVGEGAFI